MKVSKIATALALGAACAMPAMAQQSGAAAANANPGVSAARSPEVSAPDTRTMGAGPSTMDTGRTQARSVDVGDDKDLGWFGLLGLLGLLGLRRKHHDHYDRNDTRHTTAAG